MKEWKRVFRNKGLAFLLIGIMFVPALYAVIFLSSMWNAYGKAGNLPVAVVNNDKGASYQGKKINLGSKIKKQLLKNSELDFRSANEKQANKRLSDGKYYMLITIPKNFSASSTTVLSKNPQAISIKYVHNSGLNFIADKMTESASHEITATVESQIQKTYSKQLLSGLKKSKNGMNKAANGGQTLSNGLGQLYSGTTTATNGSQTITNGLNQASNNLPTMSSGASQLASGNSELSSSLAAVAESIDSKQAASKSQIDQLTSGLNQLTAGLKQLSSLPTTLPQSPDEQKIENSMNQIKSSLTTTGTATKSAAASIQAAGTSATSAGSDIQTAGTSAAKIAELIPEIAETNPQLASELKKDLEDIDSSLTSAGNNIKAVGPSLSSAGNQLSSIGNSTSSAGSSLQTVATQLNTLQQMLPLLKELENKLPELKKLGTQGPTATFGAVSAIENLESSLSTISSGIKTQAVPASNKLANGASQLYSGFNTLQSGVDKLSSGSNNLTSGLKTLASSTQTAQSGSQKLTDQLRNGTKKLSTISTKQVNVKHLSKPLKAKDSDTHKVPNMGTGLSPYMIAVGLFVGALATGIFYNLNEVEYKPRTVREWFFQKAAVFVTIAVAQGLIVIGGLIIFDGLKPNQIGMTFLVAIISALAYMLFVLMMNLFFGHVGSAVALVLLVLQLSGSAGTYPIQLSNAFFEAIHPYLPMTYTVEALRKTISLNGNPAFDLILLLIFGLVSLALMLIGMTIRRNRLVETSLVN
ncbi:putative methyl-accepting protein [Oenococcus oeni]|uniref:YhgE/Pip domain-containing protein n=1 Tax=Oenococcus oeni TaxID=1247 RepID=UPI0010B31DD7|nr:YhgE/Pip domain-containing protein [Oenococcus oeni]SYW02364.1 putative methyl-accepting protein [Oenococcus oeni]